MSRKPIDRINDIISCEKINRYIAGLDQNAFDMDEKTGDAVLRNLEIIGAAIKDLPEAIRSQLPDVDWSGLARLRDILSHAYFRVDPDIVWQVVTSEVPELRQTLKAYQDQKHQ